MRLITLHLIAFLSGFSLMGYEILGSRMLAPSFGSSVYVWGGLISVFMLGLSIGYAIGGKLADRHNSYFELAIIILISIIFIFFISFYAKNICNTLSGFSYETKYSALMASLILFTIPSICLGAASPYLVKLSVPCAKNLGEKTGYIYAASTVGSIFGTLFTSFYLILLVGTSTGSKLLCIPLTICFIILLILNNKKKY